MYLPACLSMSIYPSIYLSIFLSIYLSTYLPIYLPVHLSIHHHTCIFMHLYTHISPIFMRLPSNIICISCDMYLDIFLDTYSSIFFRVYYSIFLGVRYILTFSLAFVPILSLASTLTWGIPDISLNSDSLFSSASLTFSLHCNYFILCLTYIYHSSCSILLLFFFLWNSRAGLEEVQRRTQAP